MKSKLNEILQNFFPDAPDDLAIAPFGNGHINDTYLVEWGKKYIFQRVNTDIFCEPEELMSNMRAVCEHIKGKIAQGKRYLEVIPTVDGKNCYMDGKDCYRVTNYIDSVTYTGGFTERELGAAARAIGEFQKRLADFPAETLFETIKNFHNTPVRLENLRRSVEKNAAGRLGECTAEIAFAEARADFARCVTDGIADGSIPLRVTHNDTKLNNILFDKDTGEYICLIDLDTVMPGSMLYDFGDALRCGAARTIEDDHDVDKVYFDTEMFRVFAEGFLGEMKDSITERERALLPESAALMTFECGVRFLTDYLDGDTYFKTAYPEHNIVRARNQFALVADIERKLPELHAIVDSIK